MMPRKKVGSDHMNRLKVSAADVDRRAAPPGGHQAQHDADHDRQDLRRDDQPQGVDQRLAEQVGDRLVAERIALAQVAARRARRDRRSTGSRTGCALFEVEEDRLVQAEPLGQRRDRLRGSAAGRGSACGRVAGQDPEQEEVEGDDHEDGDHRPADLATAGSRPRPLIGVTAAVRQPHGRRTRSPGHAVAARPIRSDAGSSSEPGSSRPERSGSSSQPVKLSVRHASTVLRVVRNDVGDVVDQDLLHLVDDLDPRGAIGLHALRSYSSSYSALQ